MKGIFMNINFNKIFKNMTPYIYVVLSAYIFNLILFFYLPKSGVSFVENSFSALDYKKYDFYVSNNKNQKDGLETKNTQIQNLSKYDLKAIYFTSSTKGWIIVEEKGQNASYILTLGEQIDGYVLSTLFKDYVIFQKNKKDYKLEIAEKELVNFEQTKTEEFKAKDNGAVISRSYLNSYITNVDKIWNSISIKEIKNADKITGFQIEKITPNTVFSKLGLKDGDVIKSINNRALDSYAEALNVYNNIGNTMNLNIEILRNNETMELNYEIN